MRIAMISPVWLRTPPLKYGATELMASMLTEELVRRGHQVTLYASGDSTTTARLKSRYPKAPGWEKSVEDPTLELQHVLHAYRDITEYDIVHDHALPFGPAIGAFASSRTPVVHTVHAAPAETPHRSLYAQVHDRLHLVALSQAQRATTPELHYAEVIHNGVAVESFPYNEHKSDYALFIGRMTPGKGLHLAIQAARKAGIRLVVATKEIEFPPEWRYMEQQIKPLLGDDVELIGEVDFEQKARLYRDARCTLVPTNWDEPFGLTAIESLACGTPVIGLDRGATSEIIDHDVTGYIAHDVADMARHIGTVHQISPAVCRRTAMNNFSAGVMAERYEALYHRLTET